MKRPELPLIFSDISEKLSGIFNFSRREAVIVITVVSAAVVSALVITIIVMSVKGGTVAEVAVDSYEIPAVNQGEVPRAERPFLSDFIIYENKLQESFTGVIYSRPPVTQWTDEEVRKYWIPPEEIAIEHLQQESEKIIMDIFADVP